MRSHCSALRRSAFLVAATLAALVASPPARAQRDTAPDEEPPAERLLRLVDAAMRDRARRPSVLDGVDPRELSGRELEVVRTLRERRLTFAFEGAKVTAAVDLLAALSGIPFVITAAARKDFERAATTVDLDLRDLPLENVVNLLARQLGEYRFQFLYGAVVLMRAEEYRPRARLRVYRVADIVRRRPDFPAPKLGLAELDNQR